MKNQIIQHRDGSCTLIGSLAAKIVFIHRRKYGHPAWFGNPNYPPGKYLLDGISGHSLAAPIETQSDDEVLLIVEGGK